jgi:hypothetical protein
MTNATLTVTNGAVIACYNDNAGIWLQDGSSIVSIGTPLAPNWFTSYSTVQEQPVFLGTASSLGSVQCINSSHFGGTGPNGAFQFTKFAFPAGSGYAFYHRDTWAYSNLLVQECELWGGQNDFSGDTGADVAVINNNLFYRSPISAISSSASPALSLSNNLVFSAEVTIYQISGGAWHAYNNDFDTCSLGSYSVSNDYNAYITCVSGGRLSPNGAHDVVLSSSLTYQTGPLGNFYQGSTNLLNQGSTNADLLGLYAYTTQTNQVEEGTNLVTIGYHYVALDAYGNPDSTLWFGIPDYLADTNGALAAWEMKYFGHLGVDPNGDYDCTGTNNLQKYQTGVDPNVISFSFAVTNQYVTSSPIAAVVTVLCGVPSSIAVLVDNTNFSGATWNSYTSSNLSISIGSTNGPHDIWVGLRGLPTDATPTWDETTVILDSNTPAITITSPSNNVSFNASRVDVSGNFSAGQLQQITVNGVLVFINGTNFEALNVPLAGSTNTIIATIQDFNGDTNTATIYVVGVTNSDGSLNDPIELSATNVGGFYPLTVTFQVQTNFPGVFSNLFYDFNGDDIADYTTNNFAPLTYTYTTNGEYFPVVTVQTSVGRFSSLGGWNSTTLGSSNGLLEINVQAPPVLVSTISITDPVDLKWTASSNLYVLSGSTATITEYDTNGTSIRSKSGIGSNPSGLDVDAAGKVYVAVTGSNQVWRYYPTNSTFAADTTFGTNGCIGINSGATGTRSHLINSTI